MDKELRKRVVIILRHVGEFRRIRTLAQRMCIRLYANPNWVFRNKNVTYLIPIGCAKEFMKACRAFISKRNVWLKAG